MGNVVKRFALRDGSRLQYGGQVPNGQRTLWGPSVMPTLSRELTCSNPESKRPQRRLRIGRFLVHPHSELGLRLSGLPSDGFPWLIPSFQCIGFTGVRYFTLSSDKRVPVVQRLGSPIALLRRCNPIGPKPWYQPAAEVAFAYTLPARRIRLFTNSFTPSYTSSRSHTVRPRASNTASSIWRRCGEGVSTPQSIESKMATSISGRNRRLIGGDQPRPGPTASSALEERRSRRSAPYRLGVVAVGAKRRVQVDEVNRRGAVVAQDAQVVPGPDGTRLCTKAR